MIINFYLKHKWLSKNSYDYKFNFYLKHNYLSKISYDNEFNFHLKIVKNFVF